jgi:membrane dipeptidase
MTDAPKSYRESIVIDGLNVSNWDSPAVYKSLAAGGVTAFNATVATWENYRETLDHVQAWLQRFATYGDTLTQIKTTEDILQAKKMGKVGVILGFQNATPIENDLGHLAVFYALGVRIIQLTFHERNLLGDGCWESANAGLSNFGRDAVREMNRLGILIDLSHVGERSTLETIDHSEKPVAATHANCRSYFDNPRNKTDEAVKLLAARGGVVGATAIASFLRTQFESTLEDFIDAIDDMVERIGIDHVAFGADFTQDQPTSFWRYIGSQQGTKYPAVFTRYGIRYDLMDLYPKDLETPDKLPNLAEALDKRGYSSEDIGKILGLNWLRLFQEVWAQ